MRRDPNAGRAELFPLTAHGLTGRDFTDRWHGALVMFAEVNPRDGIPGWVDLMDFSGALLALKAGLHLHRRVWAPGQYVFLQIGYPEGIELNANTAAATGWPQRTIARFRPYLSMALPPQLQARLHSVARVDDEVAFVPWAPAADDVLGEDWEIVRRPDEPRPEPPDLVAGSAMIPGRGERP